jgi:hypothetical protein
VQELSKRAGMDVKDALPLLVELAVTQQELDGQPYVQIAVGCLCRVELLDGLELTTVTFPNVPAEGEIVSVLSQAYVVRSRGWSVNREGEVLGYLRVERYE